MPAPAFVSTTTWWPAATTSRTDVGVRPTRYSWVLTSFGTPRIIAGALWRADLDRRSARQSAPAMILGVPKEVKTHEYRVGLTPTSVREVVAAGHQVVVETNAGAGIGAPDSAYEKAGARIGDPWKEAELIVKVKEPQREERKKIAERHVLFTYLHLAPDPQQTKDLQDSKAVCIAYETVTPAGGGLPLLAPMSQVAGRRSGTLCAIRLEKTRRGM